jgi:lipocalin-like protein
MTSTRTVGLTLVFALGAALALGHAQQRARPASLKEQVVGTWRLVARDVVHPDGASTLDPGYGPKYPIGYLMYDNTGHMAVQFMGLDRPNDGSARAYDAYFGTYTIDEASKPPKVTHHREGSLNPRDVGGDVVRDLVLNGDELKLVVHNGNNPNVNVNTFMRVR